MTFPHTCTDVKVSKKVSEDPHPLDRQSGMKTSGVDKKVKKGGGGKGNIGTISDDLK